MILSAKRLITYRKMGYPCGISSKSGSLPSIINLTYPKYSKESGSKSGIGAQMKNGNLEKRNEMNNIENDIKSE